MARTYSGRGSLKAWVGVDMSWSMADDMFLATGVKLSSSNRDRVEKGALCGRGEISIESKPGPGDDEGNGGVVVVSA
jgi:hypothetical protein